MSSSVNTSGAGMSSDIETTMNNLDGNPKHTESSRIQGISSSVSKGVEVADDSGRTQGVPTALSVEKTSKEESLKLPSRKKGALSGRDRSNLRKGKWTVSSS